MPEALATGTVSSGGTVGSDSSASFADAFPSGGSPSPTTPSEQPNTSAATAPPPAPPEVTPTSPDDRSPFIPRTRFDEVNQRMKQAEAWRQQYAWAEKVPQADLQQAIGIAQQYSRDPVAFLQTAIQQLQQDPVHGQTLRSLAAKALASGRGQATMPEPDVQITDGQGNVVGMTYSEKALAARDAYLLQQVLSKVDEKYAPVVQTHEQLAHEREQLKREAAGKEFASTFMQELKTYPQFEAHKAAIGEEVKRQLAQMPDTDPRSDDPAFLEAVTLRAYNKIVVPTLQSSAQSQMLDSLQQRAAASSSVHPGSAAPSATKAYTSFKDLPPEMWR